MLMYQWYSILRVKIYSPIPYKYSLKMYLFCKTNTLFPEKALILHLSMASLQVAIFCNEVDWYYEDKSW